MAKQAKRTEPKGSAANIRAVLSQASPDQIRIGVEWYETFRADIVRTATLAGMLVKKNDVRRLAGIAAAFSTQRAPNVNLKHLFDFVHEHITSTQRQGCYHSNAQDTKARAIWDGQDPADALRGPKELAFFANITGDPDIVTVDGHAYAIFIAERITTNRIRVPKGGADRQACVDAYREIAAEFCLSPCQIQAITWVVWRDMHQSDATKAMTQSGTLATHA